MGISISGSPPHHVVSIGRCCPPCDQRETRDCAVPRVAAAAVAGLLPPRSARERTWPPPCSPSLSSPASSSPSLQRIQEDSYFTPRD
eukprot:scaffold321753_cov32-Tisochrysis_lutea.AAC.1